MFGVWRKLERGGSLVGGWGACTDAGVPVSVQPWSQAGWTPTGAPFLMDCYARTPSRYLVS